MTVLLVLFFSAPFGVPSRDGNKSQKKFNSATQITVHVIQDIDTSLEIKSWITEKKKKQDIILGFSEPFCIPS